MLIKVNKMTYLNKSFMKGLLFRPYVIISYPLQNTSRNISNCGTFLVYLAASKIIKNFLKFVNGVSIQQTCSF